jgi:NTP pyrophosphatase (non-canonical NTP hydrolase)
MDERAWDTVDQLVRWLDDSSTLAPESERLLRVMKLSEEVGETTQAIIGVLGQNPRKGVTHTWQDVEAELCDVVLTAMVALTTLNPDARKVFAERLEHVAARSLNR